MVKPDVTVQRNDTVDALTRYQEHLKAHPRPSFTVIITTDTDPDAPMMFFSELPNDLLLLLMLKASQKLMDAMKAEEESPSATTN